MKPLTATDPETKSPDLAADNLAKLRALFPELVTEGKDGVAVNLDVLKQLVGDQTVTDVEEKYGLNWHGKRAARQLALTPSTGTLRPCPEDSVDWDTTQNLMIEGDNLEVLKLLQKSYAGKVKLIYIDPPYNTGKDFVYPDNFQDNIKNYLELTGQTGEGGRKLSSNTEASGRFHTDWLNMMYPRLKLAHTLLRNDGFLVVSIDDSELANLRTLLNEVLGEENFVTVLVFDRNRKNDAKLFSVGHEYMVVYARNKALLTEQNVRLRSKKDGVEEVREEFARLQKTHGDSWAEIARGLREYYATFEDDDPRLPLARYTKVDERGPYRTDGNPSWPGGGGPRYDVSHPVTGKPCKVPSRGWVWATYERMKEEIDKGNIMFGADETTIPGVRMTLFESDNQVMRSVVFSYAQKASQDFVKIFDGKKVFDNPKSYVDLERLVDYLSKPGDLVLDFFAGSGTTAHGVMLANQSAEVARRFITVQLPELLDPTNNDQRVASNFCDQLKKPRTIAELTKERLRRAGKKIREEWEGKQKEEEKRRAGEEGTLTQKAEAKRRRGEEGTLNLGISPLPLVTSSPLQGTPPVSSSPLPPDTGFRVFKLASSNIRAWEPGRVEEEKKGGGEKGTTSLEAALFDSIDHLKTDRTEQDILFELLLKLGLDLTVAMESRGIEGGKEEKEKRGGGEKGRLSASSSPLPLVTSSPLQHSVHSIGAGTLLVCLSPSIPQADVEPLALDLVAWHKELKPAGETTVVFRDSAFADDVAKTNLTAILHQHGLETVRSL
ncbi:site-specific DNA-methyltransferase [soil metagenome]